jgi:hypothetical protein
MQLSHQLSRYLGGTLPPAPGTGLMFPRVTRIGCMRQLTVGSGRQLHRFGAKRQCVLDTARLIRFYEGAGSTLEAQRVVSSGGYRRISSLLNDQDGYSGSVLSGLDGASPGDPGEALHQRGPSM